MTNDTDVVIVGAGHNGLVCAHYLARAGLAVQVVEARDIIGGACVTEELIPGFRFSTCSNVVCWLNPVVARDLQLLERGVQFSVMEEPVHECFSLYTQLFPGKSAFIWPRERGRLLESLAGLSEKDASAWPRWERFWDKAAEIFGPFLLTKPPQIGEIVKRAEKIGALEELSTVLTTSIGRLADRYFESPLMKNHVVSPHDMGSPFDTGTGLAAALGSAVSRHNEQNLPMPRGYVRGGMGSITKAMAEVCREEGIVIRTGTAVERIVAENSKVKGVRLSGGEEIESSIVVSNADIKRTFLRLFRRGDIPEQLRQRVLSLRTDIAPLKLHCALGELPDFLGCPEPELAATGSVRICPDLEYYDNAWEDARHGRLPRAPYMDIMIPSTWDETLAPPGKHALSVWILFAPPRLRESTWPEKREQMAERLIDIIDGYAPNFRRSLVDYVLLTPHDLERRVHLTDGNIHHIDIHPSQMLWQRPLPELSEYATPLEGFYLCGAGTHPYGEVCGAPGHNAAAKILDDLSKDKMRR